MSKVVTIDGRKPPTPEGGDPEIIDILEHCLERARSGEIHALGLLMVRKDGHVQTVSRGRGQKHTLVACCEYLKHDLCAED